MSSISAHPTSATINNGVIPDDDALFTSTSGHAIRTKKEKKQDN
jgi:hypothetical protein